jgi:hypothetical protein
MAEGIGRIGEVEGGVASGKEGGTEVEEIKVYGFYNYDMGHLTLGLSIVLQITDQNENVDTRTQFFSARTSYIPREAVSRSSSLAINLRADVAICTREVASGTQHTIPNVAGVHTTIRI